MSCVLTEAEVLTQPTLTKFGTASVDHCLHDADVYTIQITLVLSVSIMPVCDTAEWAVAQSLAHGESGISGNA